MLIPKSEIIKAIMFPGLQIVFYLLTFFKHQKNVQYIISVSEYSAENYKFNLGRYRMILFLCLYYKVVNF